MPHFFSVPVIDPDFDDFLYEMSDEPDVRADLDTSGEFDEIGLYLEQMYS